MKSLALTIVWHASHVFANEASAREAWTRVGGSVAADGLAVARAPADRGAEAVALRLAADVIAG